MYLPMIIAQIVFMFSAYSVSVQEDNIIIYNNGVSFIINNATLYHISDAIYHRKNRKNNRLHDRMSKYI